MTSVDVIGHPLKPSDGLIQLLSHDVSLLLQGAEVLPSWSLRLWSFPAYQERCPFVPHRQIGCALLTAAQHRTKDSWSFAHVSPLFGTSAPLIYVQALSSLGLCRGFVIVSP